MPGDKIYSINGITTSKMRPNEVSTLLDNIDGNAVLDIEYSLSNYGELLFTMLNDFSIQAVYESTFLFVYLDKIL